jgi:hypothetical protein
MHISTNGHLHDVSFKYLTVNHSNTTEGTQDHDKIMMPATKHITWMFNTYN